VVHRIRLVRAQRRERAKPEEVARLPWIRWGDWPRLPDDSSDVEKSGGERSSRSQTASRESLATLSHDSGEDSGHSRMAGGQSFRTALAWLSPVSVPHPSFFSHRQTERTREPETEPLEATPSLVARVQVHDECTICLSTFKRGDVVRVLPCWHVFHILEIDEWLEEGKGIVRCCCEFSLSSGLHCPLTLCSRLYSVLLVGIPSSLI
jgi:hypothetical protein